VDPCEPREPHIAEALRRRQTLSFAQFVRFARPALANGAAGIVAPDAGRSYAVMGFTILRGKIVRDRHARRSPLPRSSGPTVLHD
jgi:hypothetical protein